MLFPRRLTCRGPATASLWSWTECPPRWISADWPPPVTVLVNSTNRGLATASYPCARMTYRTPPDRYGNAKLAVERELDITMRMQGLPYFAFRMHNVYGEWQNMRDPYRNAVAIFLNQIMRGEPITVYGDGGQTRAFTYVGDIVGTFLAAARQPHVWGQVYNVKSLTTSTVLDLAHTIRRAMGVPNHPIVHLPARDEVRIAYTDSTRARTVFGTWPETGLIDEIERPGMGTRSRAC